MIPRRSRRAVLVVAAVGLLVIGAGFYVLRHDRVRTHNVQFADSVEIVGEASFESREGPPGMIEVAGLVGIVPTAPITVLDVQPYRSTPGVELLAVRAWFSSGPNGALSPSGHPMRHGAPGSQCYVGPWPPAGYGASFPVQGLQLAKDDPVQFGFYVRGPQQYGDHTLTGWRIRYRTAKGKIRTVSGDLEHLILHYRSPADLAGQQPCPPASFAKKWPGYPG